MVEEEIDIDDEVDESELLPEGPVRRPQPRHEISFASMGQDFHLEVSGRNIVECETVFNRVFEKVRKTVRKKKVENRGSYA